MWSKLSRVILQNRILIIIFFIVATVFMTYHAKNLKLSYAGSKILPLTDSVFIKYNTFKKTFGEDGSVMVVGVQSAAIYQKGNYIKWVQLSNEIQKLKSNLGLDDLWEIYRQYSSTIFFFYTETQIEEYSKNGTKEVLSKTYFNLLKKYDEFGYFNNETFSIVLDSKENFDKKYESNWFYYSR